MSKYRNALPQRSGATFLCDGGVETDLIFNQGVEIREFAAHTLLALEQGRRALTDYYCGFLSLARELGVGFILDSQTWKAHPHWAADLGATADELRKANAQSIAFIAALREEFDETPEPIVLNGLIGPCGDAYAPEAALTPDAARTYHARQIGWLKQTDVDMVTATTFTQADEAIGVVQAAQAARLPIVVSFTVETDGRLPNGQTLAEAITAVDASTDEGPEYYMINCAHPDHFDHVLEDAAWSRRIHGLRCNASRRSHAELDASDSLDAGDPEELASQYVALRTRLPWLHVFGGCCGSDLRHVASIARALTS